MFDHLRTTVAAMGRVRVAVRLLAGCIIAPQMLTVCLVAACLAGDGAERTWSDRSGKYQIEADLIAVKDGQAYLKRVDGKVVEVGLDRLALADLEHLATLPEHREAVAPLLAKAVAEAASPDAASPETASPETAQSQPASTVASGPAARPAMATIEVPAPDFSGELRRFKTELWGFRCLEFSPDGGKLAAGTPGILVLYDVSRGETFAELKDAGGDDAHTALAFSPDGSHLAAGCQNGRSTVWRVTTAGLEEVARTKQHESEVKALAWTPDNQQVWSMDGDGSVRLWNANTGNWVFGYSGFERPYGDVMVSRRGVQALATDGRTVALFDLSEQKLLQATTPQRHSCQAVALSDDGGRVAVVTTGSEVRIWDVRTGVELSTCKGVRFQRCLALSPGGRLLATGGDGMVGIWDVSSGDKVHQFGTSEQGDVQHVAFSPDGIHLAATCGSLNKFLLVLRLPRQLHPSAAR